MRGVSIDRGFRKRDFYKRQIRSADRKTDVSNETAGIQVEQYPSGGKFVSGGEEKSNRQRKVAC